jgi:hypothetical protein
VLSCLPSLHSALPSAFCVACQNFNFESLQGRIIKIAEVNNEPRIKVLLDEVKKIKQPEYAGGINKKNFNVKGIELYAKTCGSALLFLAKELDVCPPSGYQGIARLVINKLIDDVITWLDLTDNEALADAKAKVIKLGTGIQDNMFEFPFQLHIIKPALGVFVEAAKSVFCRKKSKINDDKINNYSKKWVWQSRFKYLFSFKLTTSRTDKY